MFVGLDRQSVWHRAQAAEKVASEWNMDVSKLIKLAMYDIVILCGEFVLSALLLLITAETCARQQHFHGRPREKEIVQGYTPACGPFYIQVELNRYIITLATWPL